MDPPDSVLIYRLGNKMMEILSSKADTGEKLKAIADYNHELSIRPWLKELPWIAQVIADLDNLRKALVASTTAKLPVQAIAIAEFPAQATATATAELPAQASATAALPAQASATAELPAQASASAPASAPAAAPARAAARRAGQA